MKNLTIIGLTPFEKPDVNLMSKLQQAGAFPILSLGQDLADAQEALDQLDQTDIPSFGICFADDTFISLKIPKK